MYYRSVSGDVVYVEANAMNIDVEMIFEEFLEVMLRVGEIRARNSGMGDLVTTSNKGFADMSTKLLNGFLDYGVKNEGMPVPPLATGMAQKPPHTHTLPELGAKHRQQECACWRKRATE